MTGTDGRNRLLVLALDAASPALLRRWAADGTMPNVARLLREGLSADTRNVEGLYVGATWPSFYTGCNPAGHGFYWLDRLVPGSYRLQGARPEAFARRTPLWDCLGAAGRRVAVLDVPLCRISTGLPGIHVASWGDHDRASAFATHPKSLAADVLGAIGPHPSPAPCDARSRNLEEYRRLAELLREGAATRARLTRKLLAEHEWDFAIQVFSETHCAGHQLWHFHDPAHPAFDPAVTRAEGDLVQSVYAAVDAALGDVLAGLPPEVTVVLMTLHDMSYNCGASPLLGEILVRLGAMRRLSEQVKDAAAGAGVAGPRSGAARAKSLLRAAYHAIPEGIRRPLWEWRQRFNQRAGLGTLIDMDPAGSRCFMVWTGPLFAGIRLNLRGREPEGTLAPGEESDRFVAELTRDLMALVRPDSGQPLVKQVHRTRDLHRGMFEDELPDLLVEWHSEPALGSTVLGDGRAAMIAATSPKTGLVEWLNFNCRSGEHRIGGLVVLRGEGIAPGRLDRVLSILDLAPTFAARLGVAMPGVDGTPVPEFVGTSPRPSP